MTKKFTLPTLRARLATEAPLIGMNPPSLITLKLWSAAGVFEDLGLDAAIKVALQRMKGKKAYCAQKNVALPGPRQPASEMPQGGPTAHTEEAGVCNDLGGRMASLEQVVANFTSRLPSRVSGAGHPGSSGLDPAIALALEQLDALRKTLLVRVDNEMTLIRRVNDQLETNQGGDGVRYGLRPATVQPREAVDLTLDLARIQSKLRILDTINDRLAKVEDRLDQWEPFFAKSM